MHSTLGGTGLRRGGGCRRAGRRVAPRRRWGCPQVAASLHIKARKGRTRVLPDAGAGWRAGILNPSSLSLTLPGAFSMTIQRWTLAVVCAATAMLMLDIAVVNTALSRIAEDLDTGLSGLQWVVDAYTLALASDGADAPARSPTASGAGACSPSVLPSSRSPRWPARWRRTSTMLNTARAVQGIGAAIMFAVSLALLAHAFPGARERAGALAAYGATIGASFAVGPLVGGALTSGLDWQWIFLINLPIGLLCLRDHAHATSRSRATRTRAGSTGPARSRSPAGLFLLVLGAAARQRAGLDEHRDRRRADRRGGRCWSRSWRSSCASREPMLPLRPVPRPRLHRRADRRLRDLGVVLRDLPLRRRCTCSRSSGCRRSRRARVHPRHAGHASSSPARPPARRARCSPRTLIARRPRARRRGHGADARSPPRRPRGRSCCRARSSR